MRLEYRHNNAYDTVVLVDADGNVRSDWTVDEQVMRDFCDLLQHPDHWDDRGGEEHMADDYGELIATREAYGINIQDANHWAERVEFFVRELAS